MAALVAATTETLPALIDRAVSVLANARTSAEVLEARDLAGLAYDAAKCLTAPKQQLTVTELDGLAPARSGLYGTKAVKTAFPGFANLVKESIETAGPRPVTPAYQDVSLAIQDALHPPTKIDPDDPGPAYDELKDKVDQGVKREGLL